MQPRAEEGEWGRALCSSPSPALTSPLVSSFYLPKEVTLLPPGAKLCSHGEEEEVLSPSASDPPKSQALSRANLFSFWL